MELIGKQEFQTKLNNGDKFIVDFFATWCMPCKMMMPILERADNELVSSDVRIFKINVDTDRDLAIELGIRGVPTIKAFKGGQEIFTKAGIMNENEITNLSKSLLNG